MLLVSKFLSLERTRLLALKSVVDGRLLPVVVIVPDLIDLEVNVSVACERGWRGYEWAVDIVVENAVECCACRCREASTLSATLCDANSRRYLQQVR